MDRLPNELWNHTCTFLGPCDLAAFALVSSTCLVPAQWQLYTSLTLRSASPSVEDTFRLLGANTALARRVLSLSIDTDPKWTRVYPLAEKTWFDLSVFKSMKRLKTLRFRRLPCIVTDEEEEFVNILNIVYENCKSLKEIMIWGFRWPQLGTDWVRAPEELDSSLMTRPKLTKVIYDARNSSGVHVFSYLPWTILSNGEQISIGPSLYIRSSHHRRPSPTSIYS
jgi:hypothetical protein